MPALPNAGNNEVGINVVPKWSELWDRSLRFQLLMYMSFTGAGNVSSTQIPLSCPSSHFQ